MERYKITIMVKCKRVEVIVEADDYNEAIKQIEEVVKGKFEVIEMKKYKKYEYKNA